MAQETDAEGLKLTTTNLMLESVQCRLDTGRTLSIQYSPFLKQYVEVNPFVEAFTDAFFADDYTNDNPIIDVKLCWCSQYFDRGVEFCPDEFDSCRVDGTEGPITCFLDTESGAFIRGFWFICIFWFMALIYAFGCTEQGTSAQAFLRRKVFLKLTCRGQPRGAGAEQEMLLNDIETMIEQDPNRATWLLRSAFLRERRRQQTREDRSNRRRGETNDRDEGENAGEEPSNNGTNDGSIRVNSLITSGWQQSMELKVKKYNGKNANIKKVQDPVVTSDSSDASAAPPDSQSQTAEDNEDDTNDRKSTTFSLASAQQFLNTAVSMLGDTVADLGDNDDDYDQEDLVQCAICLCDVNDGDRIGDIPCGHIYCVECLKDWLKRKNHCPLCQLGGIATPQRSSDPATASNSTTASSNTESDTQQNAAEEGRSSASSDADSPATRSGLSRGGRGGLILSNFLPSRAWRSQSDTSDANGPAQRSGGGGLLSQAFSNRVQADFLESRARRTRGERQQDVNA